MIDLSHAGRDILWNIQNAWIMYVLLLVSLSCFVYGVYLKIRTITCGRADSERFRHLIFRFGSMVRDVILQRKVRRSPIPGIFHSLLFYTFIVMLITTIVILLDYDFGTKFFTGYLYGFLTILTDMAGVLFLIGVALALFRRLALKPDTLDHSISDTGLLLLLAWIIMTGFLIEGIRIDVTKDMYAGLSPVGLSISAHFSGVPEETGRHLHLGLWWLHAISVFIFVALIPYTKFFHMFIIPANAFFMKTKPAGELNRVDLEALISADDFDEDDFSIGIDTPQDLTWKHRLDLEACISCGRCETVCPSFAAGHPFSPKQFIHGIKGMLGETGDASGEIVGNAFPEPFIWYCRTCMACVEHCPAYIEHVDTLIDIRRNEVNMKGRVNSELSGRLRTMETLGNPFNPQEDRLAFSETLEASMPDAGKKSDVLYWIGCLTTFDPEKQKIARDLITVLNQNNISVSVLGSGEHCCGDPARVAGEENLFQTIAKNQVAELNTREFNTLLVSCPHCYNVLKNEYPQFGGHYNVVYYTDFLYDHVIKKQRFSSQDTRRVVTYHDPCYLGRYQKIYQSPRRILKAFPGIKYVEMRNSRDKSFCCGGGGGHFFMDMREGERINNLRITQARKTGADTLVTACPYCRHMLEDAVKLMNLEEELSVKDICSFLREVLP